jgi:hypothetical protein
MKLRSWEAFPFPNSIVLLCGCALVFVLPWLLPPTRRVISDSYNMGFNNTIAVLGVGLTLLILTGLRLRARSSDSADLPAGFSTGHFTQRDFIAAALAGSVAAAVVAHLWSIVPVHYYGEVRSFLPCSELILLGRHPYKQFQFNYGPLFLYLPVWLVHLSGDAVGTDVGYILGLVIFSIAGLFLLAYATTLIAGRQRLWVFAMLAAPFLLNLNLGVQYTAMRFAAPYAALLWLHRSRQIEERSTTGKTPWRTGSAFVTGMILCFAISPDSGLGFFIAAIIYLGALLRGETQTGKLYLAGCLLLGVAGAGLFLWVTSKAYLQSIWSFGSGGYNFPIFPSLYNLSYLLCVVFTVPALAAFGVRGRGTTAALALGWAALVTIFVAPALGRCDPGHIFCNGLGAFLGTAALLQNSPRPRSLPLGLGAWLAIDCRLLATDPRIRQLILGAAFGLLFSLGIPANGIRLTARDRREALDSYRHGQRKCERMFWKAPSPEDRKLAHTLDQFFGSYPKIGTPLGADERWEIYLKRTGKFVPEFYTAPAYGAFTEEEVAQKSTEILHMPVILVPTAGVGVRYGARQKADYGWAESQVMRYLLVYPFAYRWRREPLSAEANWASCIRRNFITVRCIGDFYLMLRNDLVKPSSH